jgi:sensor c-di-GMP phosphodiesterase-like protein
MVRQSKDTVAPLLVRPAEGAAAVSKSCGTLFISGQSLRFQKASPPKPGRVIDISQTAIPDLNRHRDVENKCASEALPYSGQEMREVQRRASPNQHCPYRRHQIHNPRAKLYLEKSDRIIKTTQKLWKQILSP